MQGHNPPDAADARRPPIVLLLARSAEFARRGELAQAARFAETARRFAFADEVCARLCARLWLRLGQPERALRALSSPPLIGALNLEFDRAEARWASRDGTGAALSLSKVLRAYAAD